MAFAVIPSIQLLCEQNGSNITHKQQSQHILQHHMRDFQLQTRFLRRERKRGLRHTLRGNSRLCSLKAQLSLEHLWEDHCFHRGLL